MRELELLKCIIKELQTLTVSTEIDGDLSAIASEATLDQFRTDFNATDFATEATLQGVLTAVDSMRDYEVRLVVDSDTPPVTWLEVRYWDAQSGALGTPQYYQPGSTVAGTPTGSLSYINPNTLLTQLVAELQALNLVDYATETTLLALSAKLNTLGQKASADSAPVVLSTEQEALLVDIETAITALASSGLATEATLSTLNNKFNTLGQKLSADSHPVVLSSEQEALLVDIESAITALASSGLATEATLSALNGKFNTLGQKASLDSHPVVLSTEQEALLVDIEAAITALASSGLATEATLSALETYVTARTLSQDRQYSIVKDTVTGTIYIRIDSIDDQGILSLGYLDENFAVVAPPANPVEPYVPGTSEITTALGLLASETTLAQIYTNLQLNTIETINIKNNTDAMVVDLAAIETELLDQGTTLDALETESLDQGTTLDSIDTRLTGSQRTIDFVRAAASGSTVAGRQSVSLTFLGTGGTLDGQAVPNGFSIAYSPNKGEDTVGSIAYTVPTAGEGVVLIGYVL